MRRYLGVALLLLLCTSAFGRTKVQGNCEQGGATITTSGLSSTQKVQQSFPSCTVTVYLSATVTTAAIYSDNAGTPLSNPFTASSTDGRWGFYVDDGIYDVQLSGGGILTPFTLGAITVNSGNSAVSGYPGADIGAQINACLAALPARGGVCDATSITGTVSNATNPLAGLAAKGFTLLLGNITINDSSCWVFSNDGLSLPKQGSRRILGAGYDAGSTGQGKAPVSGTIINNSCVAGVAKFDTRGTGVLEVSGINFTDSSGDSLPFWQTTNTILLAHDNYFYGSKVGTANNQDVFILGSTTINVDGSSTAAFQGYGTHIERNYFTQIRRAVYGQVFANGITVLNNTIWRGAGSNLAGGAPFEFNAGADPSSSNNGNVVADNLIEITNYPYAVKFTQTGVQNTVRTNNLYDPSGTFLAGVRFETNSKFNLVIQGAQDDGYAGISEDGSSLGTNTFITAHSNRTSIYPNLNKFTAGGGIQMTTPSVNSPMFNAKLTTTNDEFWMGINTAGSTSYGLWLYPAGGAAENLFQFRRYDANQRGLFINAATNAFIEALADLRMRAAAGANLWLGTNTTPDILLIGDSLLKANQHLIWKTDNTFDIGANGATRPRTVYIGTSLCLAAGTCFTGQTGTGGTLVMSASPTITGTMAVASETISGSITNYNGVATVGKGVPSQVATIDLGSQTADIGFTNMYSVPVDGTYRVSAFIVVNRAATTSSTLPALWVTFQAADGLGTPAFLTNTLTSNNTSTAANSVTFFYAKGGSTIVYQTVGYASVGATSMQYSVHIRVEAM